MIQKEGIYACLHVTNCFHVASIDVKIFVISVIASRAKLCQFSQFTARVELQNLIHPFIVVFHHQLARVHVKKFLTAVTLAHQDATMVHVLLALRQLLAYVTVAKSS